MDRQLSVLEDFDIIGGNGRWIGVRRKKHIESIKLEKPSQPTLGLHENSKKKVAPASDTKNNFYQQH